MKVLGISAGTKDGSNDSLVKEALMGAKEEGAEIEFIRLLDLDIKHCTGCIACVLSLMTGKGGKCALHDDFEWLLDKMLDADGIILSSPIFEKGAAGITRNVCDRFGPRTDRAHIIISSKIAEETGGTQPDLRLLKEKAISFMGIGGSDWSTRVECDHAMIAMSPMWTVVENIVFQWSKTIVVEDEKVAKAHALGRNLAKAAADPASAAYIGEPGFCPHCHSHEFYLSPGSTRAICCLCGMEGDIAVEGGKAVFRFEEEELGKAHDDLSGKFIHADQIKENEGRLIEVKKSDEYRRRVQRYKDFISGTVPERKA
ncbi:MAG: flavodoxin family protein [Clostridiales Family XIII bacterium]|jgi:multimeric flavodoxin WrbA|nr:flavodoxin family protein [Clostridiales Family XIII bacterium]